VGRDAGQHLGARRGEAILPAPTCRSPATHHFTVEGVSDRERWRLICPLSGAEETEPSAPQRKSHYPLEVVFHGLLRGRTLNEHRGALASDPSVPRPGSPSVASRSPDVTKSARTASSLPAFSPSPVRSPSARIPPAFVSQHSSFSPTSGRHLAVASSEEPQCAKSSLTTGTSIANSPPATSTVRRWRPDAAEWGDTLEIATAANINRRDVGDADDPRRPTVSSAWAAPTCSISRQRRPVLANSRAADTSTRFSLRRTLSSSASRSVGAKRPAVGQQRIRQHGGG